MSKTKSTPSRWVANLRALMENRALNPRSLSLKAGLNPTAVRDMLEGRTQFPRYDTVLALAGALNVAPHALMGEPTATPPDAFAPLASNDDLDLLTEIIARLQEVADEHKHRLGPRDFAAMVATIYQQMQGDKSGKAPLTTLRPKIHDLMAYETRRHRIER
jgi:transcriptional regulator with XRE-family HTH domain